MMTNTTFSVYMFGVAMTATVLFLSVRDGDSVQEKLHPITCALLGLLWPLLLFVLSIGFVASLFGRKR